MARQRLPMPPSAFTGPLGSWLRQLWIVVNGMPQMSYFTGADPNSVVSGFPGDLAISLGGNVASNSTMSRVWVMSGVPGQPSTTGWVVLRVKG